MKIVKLWAYLLKHSNEKRNHGKLLAMKQRCSEVECNDNAINANATKDILENIAKNVTNGMDCVIIMNLVLLSTSSEKSMSKIKKTQPSILKSPEIWMT
jgi:hypothetical protein